MKLFHILLPLLTAILSTKTDAQTTNAIPRAATFAQFAAPASLHAQYMAAHMLACAADRNDPAATATRSWAFVLLRLPFHAIESVKAGHESLSRAELTFLGGEAARLKTEQQDEFTDMLAGYLPLVESSNSISSLHLSNLRTVAGGGSVQSNDPGAEEWYNTIRKFQSQRDATSKSWLGSGSSEPDRLARPVLVSLRLSRQWIDTACARGAYVNLAEQLRVVAELRRHPLWDLVIKVSTEPSETPLTAEVLTGDFSQKQAAIIQAKPALLGGLNRNESQAALEEFVIAVLAAATSAK